MSKEYVLQFNLNNYISVEEPYKKDLGTVIIGKVNDDSGILNVLFDSHKEDIVNFFIELINYVSDLEAKLAEKEDQINWLVEAEFNRKWAKKYVEMRRKEDPMLCLPDSDEVYEKYFELKQQLAEKEKEYQSFKKIADENVNYLKNRILEETRNYTQDKISFAVEQLEKVKELLFSKAIQLTGTSVDTVRLYSINEIFNNQIKALKEGK